MAVPALEVLSEKRCFGGVQGFYRYESSACGGPMRFGVFRPERSGRVPALLFLAGLTCTEETFAIKAGAQRVAAELGLALVTPDTSPRETGIEGATGDWEFGEGAGFWLDATQAPYAGRFGMESVVVRELPMLLDAHFGIDVARLGISGHSMGGHGALTLALRHPQRFRSLSAFAPIVAPMQVPWGQKAFPRYLGNDETAWRGHDATALMADGHGFDGPILIDQGADDAFLAEQLRPELFQAACDAANQPLLLRQHAGYDHSYWFIQSFIEDHLRHHARVLSP
ncbi:S-formylglutathione hydrolase [Arenimonas maotaiensis]|uniref:S-formylglutathione hydrolase n=1 Tax=Arenimonas maotaiensis TaxID=1446479 RepID=A0A917FQV7_9GAMM|nr:S-formylglutathione hydrolase [Arenimonas maotaiensis]